MNCVTNEMSCIFEMLFSVSKVRMSIIRFSIICSIIGDVLQLYVTRWYVLVALAYMYVFNKFISYIDQSIFISMPIL